jgi:SAM-dependent methyltransferase
MTFDPEAVRAFEHAGWERAAALYAGTFAVATRPFIPALLDAAGMTHGRVVLDIACGPGFVTAAAAVRRACVRGLDFSAAMLTEARARHPALPFDQGDAEALPYDGGTFDAVVSNFGIHHVPRPALALREAHRVLRPGGRFAFTVWAAPSENIGWKLLFDAIARCGDPGASDAPEPGGGLGAPAACRDALATAGFGAIETRPVTAVWRHPDSASLVGALRAGTARMAALINAQDPAAMPAILADIGRASAPYRDGGGLAVPIAAVVASGVRG